MSNYDEYMEKMKKVKLDPSRKNLKPVDPKMTFEQYLNQCIEEGEELLAAEGKNKPAPAMKPQSKKVLDDALGKMSSNPYIRARTQILTKMTPEKRSVIEKMEKGNLPTDSRYDEFCKEVTRLGDNLSSNKLWNSTKR